MDVVLISSDEEDEVEEEEQFVIDLVELRRKKETNVIRISCSDIASIAGFNEFATGTKWLELLQKYLYQGLADLQKLDAKNLD